MTLKQIFNFITGTILNIGITCFLFQHFLIPGVLWNGAFYAFLFFSVVLFFFTKPNKTNSHYRYRVILLFALCIANIIWNFVGNESLKKGEYNTELKLMTYNLYFKNHLKTSSITIIKNEDPDILAIQEVTPRWMKTMQHTIEHKYPYKKVFAMKGTHGIGIYSKHEIINSETLNNSYHKPFAQIVALKISNKKVLVVNLHLASPAIAVENKEKFISLYANNYKERKAQLKQINQYVEDRLDQFDSFFIIGDLNTIKYEPIFEKLKNNWVDTYEKKGKGMGCNFPNSNKIKPIITLDYILAKGKTKIIESKVINGGSSDHLPIVAIVKI